jgi:hypothetical protein
MHYLISRLVSPKWQESLLHMAYLHTQGFTDKIRYLVYLPYFF